ncbi:MAG: TIGR00266 family protein [Deltaproteobacteria bacterium]|jgi:uncharacterized protein (TIGR00266 family)|nr:TIGR00266 family protein [Deltaproteobacteria bacterium]
MNPLPKYEILYGEAFPMLLYRLDQGETFKAESGAMVAMDAHLQLSAKMEGGVLQGLARKFLSKEKAFFQQVTATSGPGEAYFSPSFPGGIMPVQMNGQTRLRIQKDGFLASTFGVTVETVSQGLAKGLFSKEGFFILRASGQGILFLSSYGAIHPLHIPPGKAVNVDNGHLVAWDDTMRYEIRKASASIVTSITSGEGLVCAFVGPGTVYIQTRNPAGLHHGTV